MKRKAVAVFISIMMIAYTGCTGNNKNNDVNNVSQMEQIDGKSIDVINIYDIDGDRINDKVELLLDAKLNVVLMINNSSIKVFDVSNEQQIFGENLQDHFECQLRACGNTIVVGRTYTFTNKYGSTAAIDCFEYNSNQIERILSVPSDKGPTFTVLDYNPNNNIIEMETNLGKRNIILSDDEKRDYESFSSALRKNDSSPEFEYTAMPGYRIIDNNDDIEIVTRGIVTCGACPVTQEYYQKYYLSKDGISEEDSWFQSEKPELAKNYGFQ